MTGRKAIMLASLIFCSGSHSAVAGGCAHMSGSVVVNDCNYTIIGRFTGNDGSSGGFGPIKSGSREGTTKKRDAGWNINWCDFDLWAKSKCKLH